MGKKVCLNDIIRWLNFLIIIKIIVKKLPKIYPQQNFYLNNSKLIKTSEY